MGPRGRMSPHEPNEASESAATGLLEAPSGASVEPHQIRECVPSGPDSVSHRLSAGLNAPDTLLSRPATKMEGRLLLFVAVL